MLAGKRVLFDQPYSYNSRGAISIRLPVDLAYCKKRWLQAPAATKKQKGERLGPTHATRSTHNTAQHSFYLPFKYLSV
jgi:hypothetical protein